MLFLSASACACVCMNVAARVCVCDYVCVCVYINVVNMFVCVRACESRFVCLWECTHNVCVRVCACVHVFMRVWASMFICPSVSVGPSVRCISIACRETIQNKTRPYNHHSTPPSQIKDRSNENDIGGANQPNSPGLLGCVGLCLSPLISTTENSSSRSIEKTRLSTPKI